MPRRNHSVEPPLTPGLAIRPLVLAIALLCSGSAHSQPAPSNAPSASQYEISPTDVGPIQRMWAEQRNRENQERNRLRVAIPHAGGGRTVTQTPGPFTRLPESNTQPRTDTVFSATNYQTVLVCLASVLAGILAVRKFAGRFAEFLNQSCNPWDPIIQGVADDRAFSEFAASFRVVTAPAQPSADKSPDSGAVAEFFDRAPRLLQTLRSLVQQAGRAPSQTALQTALEELLAQAHSLKGMSGLPALLPIWQMAAGLEGLLKQLTGKTSNVTASTLRTISGAVDLIGALCAPGLKPDLTTSPPIRLLAVDDDRISRNVISFALKKTLHQPDLAENGNAALALAEKTAYDVVFLDIQMPGMDGFELCTKIHSLALNRETPIVFVTCHSDFEARAKAALVGGIDLIGKPYLTFEIALKALTMVLRRRLGLAQAAALASTETTASETAPAKQKTESPASPAPAPKRFSCKTTNVETNAAIAFDSANSPTAGTQPEPCEGPPSPGTADEVSMKNRSSRTRRARRRFSEMQRRRLLESGC